MKFKLLFLIIVIAVVGLFLFASKSIKIDQSSKPKVAASIFPLYDITKNIAGDELDVSLVLPAGASPHTFEPTPQDVQKIYHADVMFVVGHGLDNWTQDLVESSQVKNTITVDKNIQLMHGEDEHDHEHEDEDHEEESDGIDPHYWLSVPNAILIAEQIKDELSSIYPEKASDFELNFSRYEMTLQNLSDEINSDVKSLKSNEIATFHGAWSYFAKDHGLDIVATFEEFPGKEPTANYLREFEQEVRASGTKVIFSEPQFSTLALASTAKDLGVTISTLDPIGGAEGRLTYEQLMRYNVGQITSALQ